MKFFDIFDKNPKYTFDKIVTKCILIKLVGVSK